MFVLSEFKSDIRILPSKFRMPIHLAIKEDVNEKFSNKVVINVGLVIAVFDIVKIGFLTVPPGDGSAYPNVQFRCIVFRPQIGEVIIGTIKSSSLQGIKVTLGFFDDVLIPPEEMMQPSTFDDVGRIWNWDYEEGNHFAMHIGYKIRFRVIKELFTETSPSNAVEAEKNFINLKVAYSIQGSINESGLGLPEWWQ
ncbi:hypothetical protein CHUAL_007760 [Chamberlinius hualienensis]